MAFSDKFYLLDISVVRTLADQDIVSCSLILFILPVTNHSAVSTLSLLVFAD